MAGGDRQGSKDTAHEGLYDGVRKFQRDDLPELQEHFNELGDGQSPHTLFIGCSDSRLVPNLITRTLPGELFVIRNIANIVPLYRKSGEYLASTSAIEYAVKILKVQNIVVCGHSNCGGCRALYYSPEQLKDLPHTEKWLELAAPVKEEVLKYSTADEKERALLTEQANIRLQLQHLLSFPYIRKDVEDGRLRLLGWYFDIESGQVYDLDTESRTFIPID